jgi:hypothetical protein
LLLHPLHRHVNASWTHTTSHTGLETRAFAHATHQYEPRAAGDDTLAYDIGHILFGIH